MNDLELVRRLQEVVVVEGGLKSVRDLLKYDHEWRKAKFRDAAIYLARIHTDLTVEKIGALFGARHHTTITCCIRREKLRIARKVHRHDKRTWAEWHDYIYSKAVAADKAAVPPAPPPEPFVPEPETPAPEISDAEKGPDKA